MAAYEIVSKCGGTTKGQYVLWTDNCLFSLTEFADEASALLCHERSPTAGPSTSSVSGLYHSTRQ